ncbi:hypothetical protein AWV80_33570 [Cupriavidus sp. UYMU48A]|nr:hypothetical protein AWV80_33570 [Cupriavidus sp. UYMU48A]
MPFLDWVNKNQAKEATGEVPYHLLKQESTHGDVAGSNADNLLIQGDNLLALKALVPFYAGRVKCIFIDPPYNTQSAFEHYDDKLEHSQWLSMMYPRLVLLRELLAPDGSIWVTLDDNEAHYLKVLMDEVFGRQCFVANLIWEKADSPRNSARQFSTDHDHILVYSKTPDWQPFRLPRTEEANSIYTNLMTMSVVLGFLGTLREQALLEGIVLDHRANWPCFLTASRTLLARVRGEAQAIGRGRQSVVGAKRRGPSEHQAVSDRSCRLSSANTLAQG